MSALPSEYFCNCAQITPERKKNRNEERVKGREGGGGREGGRQREGGRLYIELLQEATSSMP